MACTLRTRNLPKFSATSYRPYTGGASEYTVNTALLLVTITRRCAVVGYHAVLFSVACRHALPRRYMRASSRILYCGHSIQYSHVVIYLVQTLEELGAKFLLFHLFWRWLLTRLLRTTTNAGVFCLKDHLFPLNSLWCNTRMVASDLMVNKALK